MATNLLKATFSGHEWTLDLDESSAGRLRDGATL